MPFVVVIAKYCTDGLDTVNGFGSFTTRSLAKKAVKEFLESTMGVSVFFNKNNGIVKFVAMDIKANGMIELRYHGEIQFMEENSIWEDGLIKAEGEVWKFVTK